MSWVCCLLQLWVTSSGHFNKYSVSPKFGAQATLIFLVLCTRHMDRTYPMVVYENEELGIFLQAMKVIDFI